MPVMTNDDIVGIRADYGTLARMELDFANKHMGVFGVDYSPKVIAALCNAILALELERDRYMKLLKRVATGEETAVIALELLYDIEEVLNG